MHIFSTSWTSSFCLVVVIWSPIYQEMCLFHDDSQIPRISLIKYEKQSKKSRLRRRKETLSYNQDCIPRKIYSWIETQSLKKKLYSCFLRIAKGYIIKCSNFVNNLGIHIFCKLNIKGLSKITLKCYCFVFSKHA